MFLSSQWWSQRRSIDGSLKLQGLCQQERYFPSHTTDFRIEQETYLRSCRGEFEATWHRLHRRPPDPSIRPRHPPRGNHESTPWYTSYNVLTTDLIVMGKVRYIGASSMYAYQFLGLQHVAEKNGWTKFISMQNYYNLVYREEEREMLPACKETGVGYISSNRCWCSVIPWSPVARGSLAKPRNATSLRTETDQYGKLLSSNHESEHEIIDRVEALSKKKGVSMAKIATAWMLSKDSTLFFGLTDSSCYCSYCGIEFRGEDSGDGGGC